MQIVGRVEAFGERIAAAGDGRRWALAHGDRVTLWDGERQTAELPPAGEQVLDLRFDGETLLAAPGRARGGVWDRLPPLFRVLHPFHAVAATWDDDGRLLVAATGPPGDHQQRVGLYDGTTRAGGAVLWADDSWQRVEAVAAGSGRLAAAALEVRVWDAAGAGERVAVASRAVQVRTLALTAAHVVAGYADGHVAVDGGGAWEAHDDEAGALALLGDGRRLVTGGGDGRVALWSLDGALLDEIELGVDVAGVAPLGDGRLLALHRLPETGVTLISAATRSDR